MVSKSKVKAQTSRGKSKAENNDNRKAKRVIRQQTKPSASKPSVKTANRKRIDSAEFFKAVVEHSHDAILLLNSERKILYASPAIAQISGYKPEELIGKHGFEFNHPDDLEATTQKFITLLQNPGKTISIENRIKHKNGSWFWVDVTATNFLDHPQVQAVVLNMRDITERRKAEDALRASDERYRSLFSNSMDAVLLTAPDGSILEVNPTACEMFGHSEEELTRGGRIAVVDVTDPRLGPALEERARTGMFKGELTFIRKDGSRFPGEISTQIFTDQSGQKRTSMVIRDITERIRNEEALRESEQRYKTLFDAVPIQIFTKDRDGRYTSSNAENQKYWEFDKIGYTDSELAGTEATEEVSQRDQRVIETGERVIFEQTIPTTNLGWRTLLTSKVPLHDAAGNIVGLLGASVDITERKQAEARQIILYEILHAVSGHLDADEIARAAVDTIGRMSGWSSVGISLPDADKETWQTRAGYGMLIGEYGEQRPMSMGVIGRTYRTGKTQNVPDVSRDPDYFRGEHPVTRSQLAVPIRRREQILGVINIESEHLDYFTSADVTLVESLADTIYLALDNARLYTSAQQEIVERIRAGQALRESEALYRQAIEVAGAVPYYESYYDNGAKIKYDFIGDGIRQITGYGPEEFTATLWDSMILDIHMIDELAGYTLDEAIQHVRLSDEHPIWKCEHRIRHRNGEIRWVFEAAVELRDEHGVSHGSIGTYQDITERKRAEESLREAETKYRNLVERLSQVIYTSELGTNGVWAYVSPQIEQLLGFTPQEWLNNPGLWYQQVHPKDRDIQLALEEQAYTRKESFESEYRILTRAGNWIWIRDSGHIIPSQTGGMPIVQGVLMDVSERKRAEEDLSLSKAQLLANLNNTPNVAIQWYDKDGHVLYWNPASEAIYGWESKDALGKTLDQLIHTPEEQKEFMRILAEIQETNKPFGPYEAQVHRRDGAVSWVLATTFSLPMNDNQIGFVCMDVDIAERKKGEEQIQRQLWRLNALHSIDMAINSSVDMQITLEVLLNQVISQLNVDAADVLVFNQPAQSLEYMAGRGFRSNINTHFQQRLSESLAGRVILERRTIHVSNMMEAGKNLRQILMLANDSFVEYFAVPLIAKGQIKGVLEVFHRTAMEPEPDWMNFLEVIAGQAAIAIDNSQLVQGLQRSNMEIVLAYDATIEGWSHAMDLRDKETEGHTQRVTEMAVRLAQTMGINDKELVHIRRGALLHDIGKLGVPDNILLKAGQLTDEEWQVMRQHPTFAYEMLLQISYLRPALEIPYSHHEKWDGTGYPQKLSGERIPLAARIFAVADVWDALVSNRPYRSAWTKEQALEYIREQSGKHFDPKVVEAFLRLISENF